MRRLLLPTVVAGLLSAATACANAPTASPPSARQSPTPAAARAAAPTSPAAGNSAPAPAAVEANELGMVPVLMYHRIVENPSGVYERSPEQYRAELERLARSGYVPVTAAAYVSGRIDIPAGKHPVVLTFDDSTRDQLSLDASGRPQPDTAVGILLDVAEEYPAFRPVATFFVNSRPFAAPDTARALSWLHEHGFDIGNHTYGHENLGELSAAGVQRQLAKLQRLVATAVPGAEITTAALPLGVSPDPAGLVSRGSWNGISYDYDGVFLVGARPAPSPYDENFDPLGIPRIRSQGPRGPDAEYCSTHWLNYLDKHPERRYTSDGDPHRVSFPQRQADELAEGSPGAANPY